MRSYSYKWSDGSGLLTVNDYRLAARRRLPRMVWAYLENGAEEEAALRANRTAFDRWALRSQVLTGSLAAPRTKVAGKDLSMPVLLAPTGLSGLAHWSGERAAARAAESAGITAIVSTASSWSIEEIAEATDENHFFQLYPTWADADVKSPTKKLLDRARDAGYSALFVTVDAPVIGNRVTERRYGMGLPPVLTPGRILSALSHPRWAFNFARHQRVSARNFVDVGGMRAAAKSLTQHAQVMNPSLNWNHVAWMRDQWSGPFFIKGIMSGEDADRAMALGADGVVVSNHGGRQLADAPATLDALSEVALAVGSTGTILIDGGFRRGADVVKALCLGAKAVCVGRPHLYGLAVGGQTGVESVLDILRDEIARTLVLMGVADLSQLNRSWLSPSNTQVQLPL